MISVRNIEKFVDDHPEIGLDKSKILEQANGLAHEMVLSGGSVIDLLGDNLEILFFREFNRDVEHLKIAEKDRASWR
ncbi:MAG: hypothetical protein ABFQ53_01165 [Patescibacteria group bacterium]